jgi:rubrerythrin
MKQTASTGHNRTGIVASEGRAEEMQRDMERYAPSSHGTTEAAGKVRILYSREDAGRGLGSVPPPSGLTDKAKVLLKGVKGDKPVLFMDKLGERLAFERSGTRLYEALVSKHEVDGGFDGGPARRDLIDILNEEHRHFALLIEAMTEMGGDPTAMTPSADLAATASEGIVKVITDPRTSLFQGLEAILVAELTDCEGWRALNDLADQLGEQDLVEQFTAAERIEQDHLAKVRRWLQAGRLSAAS